MSGITVTAVLLNVYIMQLYYTYVLPTPYSSKTKINKFYCYHLNSNILLAHNFSKFCQLKPHNSLCSRAFIFIYETYLDSFLMHYNENIKQDR